MTNNKRSITLALSLLLLGQLAVTPTRARAGSFDLPSTADSKGNASEGNFGRQRFTLTFDSRFGYDDNTLAQPDSVKQQIGFNAAGKPVYRNFDTDQSDSAFLNFALGVGYTAVNPRLRLTIGADVGVNYFFDRPGRDYDVNGGLSARVTYKASPRLLLEASSYNAYESEGDFGATTLTNFNGAFAGGARPSGTTAERNGDFFYTTNYLAATYQFSPRISAVLSDTFVAFAYEDEPYSTIQDRIENIVGTEARYQLNPTLSLAADYRFGYVDFFGVNNDSYTHYLLGGFDYIFNPRLRGSLRAGAEFREYIDAPGDEVSPYVETTLNYDLNKNAHLAFVLRYGIEEGDLSANNTKSNTLRTGISYEQNFTARISGYLGFYYTHSQFSTPEAVDPTQVIFDAQSFNEDTFDVALGARYAINRHFAAEIGYTHTTVLSGVDVREYDRNRVFAGIRFAY